jgi:hypothetical protein
MRPQKHSLRKQPNIRLDKPVAASRRVLLILMAAGSLLAESIAVTGQSLAQVSPFEHQVMKLRAESARFEREKDEMIRRQESEHSRVASYNSELLRVVSEFQNHIADQHQQHVSCKKCRHLTRQMSELSKKIERGVR